MQVTLADVAKRAGFSKSAVSQVLAGQSGGNVRISEATRKRILNAASELGYVIDASARQLRCGVSTLLGVLIHDLKGSYASQFLYYISLQMAQMGKEVILGVHTGDAQLARYHVSRFRSYRTCGVVAISSTSEAKDWMAECVAEARTGCGPVIAVSFGGDVGPRPGLHIDYDWECEQFCRMAVADGRSHVIMARRGESTGYAERFRRAARAAGLRHEVLDALPSDPWTLAGQVAPRLVEARRTGPVAVMTSVDTDAVIIAQQLLKRGLTVPQDVAILGYGNFPLSQVSSPTVSTVDISGAIPSMVEKTVDLLNQQELSGAMEEGVYAFRPGVVVRESFAPPAGWEKRGSA